MPGPHVAAGRHCERMTVPDPHERWDRNSDGVQILEPTAVICGPGKLPAVEASLLQCYGGEQVIHVVEGGVPLWKRQGWPTEPPEKV